MAILRRERAPAARMVSWADEPPDAFLGLTLGARYRLDRLVLEGGMARIYESTDLVLQRRVAVKCVHPHYRAQSAVVARLGTEALAVARVQHPHVVTLHDANLHADPPYLVFEYLHGVDVLEWTAAHHIASLGSRAALLLHVCLGTHALHRAGILHRDIKPENVMVVGPPDNPLAKLVDLGVALLDAGSAATPRHTSPGDVCGTPEFMSPEQAQGRPLDERSDVYALGLLGLVLLHGQRPLARGPVAQPTALDTALVRALSTHPDDRQPSARALADDIQNALHRVSKSSRTVAKRGIWG